MKRRGGGNPPFDRRRRNQHDRIGANKPPRFGRRERDGGPHFPRDPRIDDQRSGRPDAQGRHGPDTRLVKGNRDDRSPPRHGRRAFGGPERARDDRGDKQYGQRMRGELDRQRQSNRGRAHAKPYGRGYEESRRRDARDDFPRDRHDAPAIQQRERREHPGGPRERDIVFGVEPIRELITAAPGAIRTLHLRAGDQRRFADEIERVRAAGGQVIAADDAALQRMAGSPARHQGIIASVRQYRYVPLEEVLAAQPDPLLIVDGVSDPRNLGALLRSAEGAGAGAVVLARDHTAGITPAAIKSSAGAWVHLKIAQCGNVVRTLEGLKQEGYWVAALAPDGAETIYGLDVTRRLALVVGAEGGGVRELVRKTADFVVSIPMRGKVDSLNVSVAGAVALFEIARRREGAEKSRAGDGGGARE